MIIDDISRVLTSDTIKIISDDKFLSSLWYDHKRYFKIIDDFLLLNYQNNFNIHKILNISLRGICINPLLCSSDISFGPFKEYISVNIVKHILAINEKSNDFQECKKYFEEKVIKYLPEILEILEYRMIMNLDSFYKLVKKENRLPY